MRHRDIALDLWARWNQDVAPVTLLARRDFAAVERLIPHAEAIVNEVEQAAGAHSAPDGLTAAQREFQRRAASYNARTFLAMLKTVAANQGDPPVPARWRAQAFAILDGQTSPEQAIRSTRNRVELLPGELDRMIRRAEACQLDPRPLLWAAGRLAAALSLPRDELVRLFGGPAGQLAAETPPAKAKMPFRRSIKQAIDQLARSGMLDRRTVADLRKLLADPNRQDELIERLEALGGGVGPSPPLRVEDFYRPGRNKFELRWPLDPSIPMAVPFQDLDRKTQFFILFREWTRREMEAMTALNAGNVDGAKAIFHECLARAQQLKVHELVARSYEGFMRIAQKRGDRKAESAWLAKAAKARRG